ncbi:hypothetical protein PQR34_42150 [Paraburkholderia sediminicola]|uniref:hypothetical protein n=1 Tax=Paraburkholderia sediminicola TaxID=458836 RepID=UPI0038B8A10D
MVFWSELYLKPAPLAHRFAASGLIMYAAVTTQATIAFGLTDPVVQRLGGIAYPGGDRRNHLPLPFMHHPDARESCALPVHALPFEYRNDFFLKSSMAPFAQTLEFRENPRRINMKTLK